MQELLLATDLDGTLIGDDNSLKELNEILNKLRADKCIKIVYVTGRSLQLYEQLEAEKSLIVPDTLLTAMGTEIYVNSLLVKEWPKVARAL